MGLSDQIGFIQGRLSPVIEGKIQCFPWNYWRDEFELASTGQLFLMEWTLDHDRLYENPFNTREGQREIKQLCQKFGLSIPSVTGDCFMQAPFFKLNGDKKGQAHRDFELVVRSCAELGVSFIVFPLVDEGSIENDDQKAEVVQFFANQKDFLKKSGVQVVFESDYGPQELAQFIELFAPDCFGINYDTGNSAALGFDPIQEFQCYGDRIANIHIKDRPLGGTTIALGQGAAPFDQIFSQLAQIRYRGNLILQTARSLDNKHLEALLKYVEFVKKHCLKNGI